MMILVLLYSFSESEDSILGYRFCQKLLQEGHDLVVTTTTPKNQGLQEEIEAAKKMKGKGGKSVTLIQPDYEEFEHPNPEWIDKHYKTYFWHLSKLKNIDAIVGLLPGTTKTATDLQKVLKSKKVSLLTTSKIDKDQSDLRAEICSLSQYEILSVGPDLKTHFDVILDECVKSPKKHKQIFLKPDGEIEYKKKRVRKVVSVWNQGYAFLFKGKRLLSAGSKPDNFETVGQALKMINQKYKTLTPGQRIKSNIPWHVYGLPDEAFKDFTEKGIRLVPQERPALIEEIEFHNSLVFIVPDETEATFNFTALEAIWRGVPTLIPKGSSIGKFLLRFPCLTMEHCLVDLVGDSKTDKIAWAQKIENEILQGDVNPAEWAKQLSTYLRNIAVYWQPNFNVPKSSIKDTLTKSIKKLKGTRKRSGSSDIRSPTTEVASLKLDTDKHESNPEVLNNSNDFEPIF